MKSTKAEPLISAPRARERALLTTHRAEITYVLKTLDAAIGADPSAPFLSGETAADMVRSCSDIIRGMLIATGLPARDAATIVNYFFANAESERPTLAEAEPLGTA